MIIPMNYRRFALLSAALAAALLPTSVGQARPKPKALHIVATATIGPESIVQAKSAMDTLSNFVKEETGLESTIIRNSTWQSVVDGMQKGDIGLGVFEGYEFAWAQGVEPKLKPLVIGVNVHQYPIVDVVVAKDGPADLAGVKGKAIAIPEPGKAQLRLVLDHLVKGQGGAADSYFSKVETSTTAEDALDDLVDGKFQAAVVDRVAMEMFQRRKSARFARLKTLSSSQPLPPPMIGYVEGKLDPATAQRFAQGVLRAGNSRTGQNVLNLLRLSGFESVPKDLDKVLDATRKTYSVPTHDTSKR